MPYGIYQRKNSKEIKRLESSLVCGQCGKKYKLKTKRSLEYLKIRKFCSLGCFHKSSNIKNSWFKKGHKSFSKKGELSPNWLGNNVSYGALHFRIRRALGSAKKCQFCGTKTAKKYEWASKEHKYLNDTKEWLSLCCKCHRNYDKTF